MFAIYSQTIAKLRDYFEPVSVGDLSIAQANVFLEKANKNLTESEYPTY